MGESENAFPGLQNALDAESMVLGCVRELYQDTEVPAASNKMLRTLGRYLGADRTYLFDIEPDHIVNTYEWCAEGVEPELDRLTHIDVHVIDRWMKFFERGDCVIIEDLEELSDGSPLEYEVLSFQNVSSLAAAPLERDGRIVGFIGIDNPPAEKIRNIAAPLKTLGYFYLMTLERLDTEEKLRALSYRDELTGLHNRNRYMADVEKLAEGGSLGVIFLDVNDLKEINDRFGHGRGDEILRLCADRMTCSLPHASVYRIGGDEFVALAPGCTREAFDAMVRTLKGAFDRTGSGVELFVSVGARWSECIDDPHGLIAEADAEMYRKKRSFHLDKALAGVVPWEESRVPDVSSFRADRGELLREYNMLLGVLGIGVVKYRLVDDFNIIWANDRFYELTGRTREEYSAQFGTSVENLFAHNPEDFARLSHLVKEAYERNGSFDGLVRMPRRSGGMLWVRLAGTCTNERIDGAPVVYSTLTDVTDLLEGRLEGFQRTGTRDAAACEADAPVPSSASRPASKADPSKIS